LPQSRLDQKLLCRHPFQMVLAAGVVDHLLREGPKLALGGIVGIV
jgi:hypothetical protein